MKNAGSIRVGIGGWVYRPWRGTFYPAGLPQARELSHASRQLTAIEINGTFYGAQKPASFRRWHDATPEGFVFSVKGPRFATHRSDLATAGPSIDRFFGSGVLELGAKLGPVLWQFAPSTRFDETGFASFFELLPHRVDGLDIRHVVEVRHQSFASDLFIALLRRHQVSLAFVDDDNYPAFDVVTGHCVYARLRRCREEEAAGYTPQALDRWAERFRDYSVEGGYECFVYFINGAKVRAPAAARALLQRLAN